MDFLAYLSPLKKHFASIPTGSASETVKAHLEPIMNYHKVLWRSEREITFFGAFKAGKSTLINAVVGENLVPTRVNRATGVVTRIGYAPQKTALIHRASNGNLIEEPVDYQDLAKYILLDVSEGISKAPVGIDAVSLNIPLSFLQPGLILVDTPGLLDNKALTQKTYEELEKSDLAVMVLSADKMLSQDEREAIEKINKLLNGNIIFNINRLNLVDEEERQEILDWAKFALQGVGNFLVGEPRIFATNAKGALLAKQNGNRNSSAVEEIREFEQWLETLFKNSAGDKLVILSRLGVLESYLKKASTYFQFQLSEAQTSTKNLRKTEEEILRKQQNIFQKTIKEDRLRLSSFQIKLNQLGEEFVRNCNQRVEKLIDSDPKWSDKLKDSLNSAVQEYVHSIYQGVKRAGIQTSIKIPSFEINQSRTNPEVSAAKNPTQAWGTGLGIVLGGILGPEIWLVSVPMGAAVGNWLGKKLGVDVKKKTLESVEKAARNLLSPLNSEANKYIDTIDKLLINYGESNIPKNRFSNQFYSSQKTEQYYSQLVDWCNKFKQTITQIKAELLK